MLLRFSRLNLINGRSAGPAFLLCMLAVWPRPAAAASEPDLTAAWEMGATFFAEQALREFTAAGGNLAAGPREARFGRAAMLLTANPVTTRRRDEAVDILTRLAAEPAADELHLAAHYLLGRIAQVFVEPTDAATAARHYTTLISTAPYSAWSQLALSRHALVLLFTPAGPAEPGERLAAVEALLDLATGDPTRRNLHLALARARMIMPEIDPAGALPHLRAAIELGGLDYATYGAALAQIIILLNLEDRRAETAPFLELFIRDHFRDHRRFLFERELADLQANPAGVTLLPLPPRR
jgi:hypothetical protein